MKRLLELYRLKLFAERHDLHRVDFPGFDNAERKGSDGVVEAESATAWVPAGN
jgi:hypothetical protein